jgi:hypothetical protein
VLMDTVRCEVIKQGGEYLKNKIYDHMAHSEDKNMNIRLI